MRLFFFLAIFFVFASCFAQTSPDLKRDRVWLFGYYGFKLPENAIRFDFNPDTAVLSYFSKPNYADITGGNVSICDTAGNLLLYSNGCHIFDAAAQVIPNGDTINKSSSWNNQCSSLGYGLEQGVVLIPRPGFDDDFYLFSQPISYFPGIGSRVDRILFSRVARAPSGDFTVSIKDSLLIKDDSFFDSEMIVCRHGNGRDWWLLAAEDNTNGFHLFHIGPQTITPDFQTIGNEHFTRFGQSAFSPDGTRYIRYNWTEDVQIFDFDRCTGILSNPVQIPITDAADTLWAAGVAVSASSRYLYIASSIYLYQFDLWAADIAASRQTVAVYDGFQAPPGFSTIFYQMALAPDGRIYISGPGGKQAMHVIEHPDSAGLACQAIQHKYVFPVAVGSGMPNFPNYRLGKWVGSPCDTVAVTGVRKPEILSEDWVKIYPNPVDASLTVKVEDGFLPYHWTLYTISGKMIGVGDVYAGVETLKMAEVPAGVYFLRCEGGVGGVVMKKVVVAR